MLVVEPLLTYRFGRVQETMKKAVSKGIRITVGYSLLLLLLGCVREWLSVGTVFGRVLSRPVLPMASMPAGGFIVLGVLCAVWRTLAKKYKNYLTSEARGSWRSTARKRGSLRMNDVMQAVGVFFGYAVLAVFAQNAVFTRGLGVSRLVQLVGDERTSSGWFALLLCVTQVLVAPLAFYAGGFVAAQPNPAQLRPLVYLACVAVVSLFEFIMLWTARGKRHGGQLLRILPLASVNSSVWVRVMVERTQSFTLEQSMGFGLGSGLGYLLAVMLVTELTAVCAARPSRRRSGACPSRSSTSACWRWLSMVLRATR